jgi:hypothetical protein
VDEPTEESLLAANDAFYQAFNARDLVAMEGLWARTVPVACVHPNTNALAGRETVMASWALILENPGQPRIAWGGAQASLIGSSGYVVCRELVQGHPLVATNLFVHEAGEWRIVHHHSSPLALIPGG